MKFSLLAVVAAPALVAAQYGNPVSSTPASSAASSSAAAATPSAAAGQHLVQVAPGATLTFSPNSITAAANETVTFLFPTSGGFQHSVTQSTFANPCTLLSGGFDSGLQNNNMQFTLTITNASQRKSIHSFVPNSLLIIFLHLAIWFFCKQTSVSKHCGAGMVGGINIPAGPNSVDAFVNAAKAIGNNEQVVSATGGLTGVGAAATAPASPASATASAATSTSSTPSGAERLVFGSGSLLASLFAAFALA